jgi:TRAP-type C4-dicarboxylate transport system substrate-binding protein
MISKRKFFQLDPQQQNIILKASREATMVERKADNQSEIQDMDTLKKLGSKINEVDVKPFIKMTAPVRQKAVKQLGLEALLNEIDKLK